MKGKLPVSKIFTFGNIPRTYETYCVIKTVRRTGYETASGNYEYEQDVFATAALLWLFIQQVGRHVFAAMAAFTILINTCTVIVGNSSKNSVSIYANNFYNRTMIPKND